ncbi:MAG: ATP-dependent DNA helicase RecQ [Flavobacteriales bacterium]|nr:ATP-dependent DNA helicase RecQ [Flavobacteriales bacterium]
MEKIRENIHNTLTEFFGFKKFKGNQEETIESIISGIDTFTIMPTGGGKSLCYQLPALIMDGTAIIISPLIALMKNQVDTIRSHAKNQDIVHFLNSTLNKKEFEEVKMHVLQGTTKLLFVAPETISKEANVSFFKNVQISFFAIDEAHCISEWGHDFRPEYRKLKTIISNIGKKPIIALTATATQKVKKDIVKNLGLENYNFFLSSFNRPNLYYEIKYNLDPDKEIVKFIKLNNKKSGIIYCLSRKKAEEVSELLNLNNIKSLHYHAGLDSKVRKETQEAFLMEKVNVIVATIAFGMGIDKPDVRFVIHYNLPKSLENYYQETGRAGRDGGEGKCILFYNQNDVEKFQNLYAKKPVSEKEINMELLEEMIAYISIGECRRQKILHYFGEKYQESHCHKNCDNCNSQKEKKDVTQELLIILKGLFETNTHFHTNEIISVLKGKNNKIQHYDISGLNCFKQLISLEDFTIKHIIGKAIINNLIEKNTTSYGKISITEKGKLFIKNPTSFFIKKHKKEQTIIKEESPTIIDKTLLEILKTIRKKIANKNNLPPFIIFQDPSLEDMSIQYPTTIEELKNIIGVGHGKAEKFGKQFIEKIKHYVQENNIARIEDFVVKSKAKKNDLKIFIIQSADKKIPFEDIVDQKNITMDTLIDEIEIIVNSGTKINIDYHINEILDEEQQEEIREYFLYEAKNDSIIEADSYFEQEYEEQEIKLVKIKLMSDIAN